VMKTPLDGWLVPAFSTLNLTSEFFFSIVDIYWDVEFIIAKICR